MAASLICPDIRTWLKIYFQSHSFIMKVRLKKGYILIEPKN